MYIQQPFQQSTETLRVRFYRAYLENTENQEQNAAPLGEWLQKIEKLPFEGQPSRYLERGNGRRVYTKIDTIQPTCQFRINRTTYQGIPPSELHGEIDTEYLDQGQGLMDTWYATMFDHITPISQVAIVAIATKGNIAFHIMLRDYIEDKIQSEAALLKIEQLAHRDILKTITSMGDGTLFEISVKPAFVEKVRAVDSNLADALKASQNVYEQKELTQVIRPDRAGRHGLLSRFIDPLKFMLGDDQNRALLTRLRLGGMFGAATRATIINLLSNDLCVDIDVPYINERFAVLDRRAVYAEIQMLTRLLRMP